MQQRDSTQVSRVHSSRNEGNKEVVLLTARSTDWKDLPEPDLTLVPRLITWFDAHGRRFPWRDATSEYHILCAEIMLQRTKAAQVAPVFLDFSRQYSKPEDFLQDGLNASHQIFRRLGLTWRAPLFVELHRMLVERHGGNVPREACAIMGLPGVGAYVAAAVRVFAFGESLTVVDSNVLRILGRYHGVSFPEYARRSIRVLNWAKRLAPGDPSACRRWNWALIDLGALICTSAIHRVEECPISEGCWFTNQEMLVRSPIWP